MKKRLILFMTLIMTSVLMAGCMYPEDQKIGNQIPAQDQLDAVQRAINEYKEDTGVLPIKNRDMDTDIYIKYLVDFEKLVPKYISGAPANSYEKGGIFQYVIYNPEENPTVKLVDLRIPDKIRDINMRKTMIQNSYYEKQIGDYIFTLDHKNLNYTEPLTIQSPYTNNLLPIVITTTGEVIVDYRIDLNLLIQEKGLTPTPGEDIRAYLAEYYPVVPAYSVPYTVNEENEPIFMFSPK